MRFCLGIFESDTVKNDCPVQIFRKNDEMYKDLIMLVYLTSFTVFFWRISPKEALKMKKSSENDQLTGHFQSFFYLFLFRPFDPKSEKKSRKSTNKKILA